MNFLIFSSQAPRSRRALEDLAQNFEENIIFRRKEIGRKLQISWFFILFPLLHLLFLHFSLPETHAKSLKFQDRLAPTTEKRTPNFFNLPWEISDLSCFTCFPSWFLTSSGWWEIENIGYAYAANLFECYFSRFASVSVRVIRRRCARSAWNFKYRVRLHAATCGYMQLHAATCGCMRLYASLEVFL